MSRVTIQGFQQRHPWVMREEPMSRLANLGAILERPWLLAALSVFGLAAWGVITFGAVWLAVVSAARATATRPSSPV